MMKNKYLTIPLLLGTLALSSVSWGRARARVSFHRPYRGHTLAARGIQIGSVYEFRVGRRKARGRVVDAAGRPMRKMGRKFDLSDELFTSLFGSTKRGVGVVQYRLIRRGTGRLIAR